MSTYDILNGENYTVLKRLTCTECHLYQRCIRGEFSLYRVKAVSLNKVLAPTKLTILIHMYIFQRVQVFSILFIKKHKRYSFVFSYDIYRRNSVNSLLCSCGLREDADHFYFICKKYLNARYK